MWNYLKKEQLIQGMVKFKVINFEEDDFNHNIRVTFIYSSGLIELLEKELNKIGVYGAFEIY